MGAYVTLDSHGDAITLHGLKRVLASMRWDDLETFAAALEAARSDGQTKSARKLTASMVDSWSPHATIQKRSAEVKP